MKTIKIISLITIVFWANSCKDFDELQNDPNRTSQTHPGLLLTNIEAAVAMVLKETRWYPPLMWST